MCGIIGIIGKSPVAEPLLDALRRLEYRGYDSAGIATLVDGHIERRRAQGKLSNLAAKLAAEPLKGTIGIGHTRWATHGRPNEINAHPHATDKVAVVHNGIIENHLSLRKELEAKGLKFESETDTEVVAQLITSKLNDGLSPKDAVAACLPLLDGAFALGLLFTGHSNFLIGARRGSPLAIGYGNDEMFLGSDALALAPFTNKISYLEEGDWAIIEQNKIEIFDASNEPVERKIQQTSLSGAMIGKGGYRHFMLKEIHEQPAVVGETLASLLNTSTGLPYFPELPFKWEGLSRVTIVACGTASYAGTVAKYWFEQYARLPVEVDVASEFRYREAPLSKDSAMIVVSQSGETADTLAALNYAKDCGCPVLAIVNVPQSAMARLADAKLLTLAGPEISVASTKAFTTQLTVLAALAIAAAIDRKVISHEQAVSLVHSIREAPALMSQALTDCPMAIEAIAHDFAEARDVLYLGRGLSFPLALEGALKLKELAYIHAEAYAAGEMKHGPIALIDEDVPVVILAPHDRLYEKTASNLQEVAARGGQILLISDKKGIAAAGTLPRWSITLPDCPAFVTPLLYSLPMQLLAYHTAVAKGTDVDQPRNLAKSVTVE